jgi:hypothetical protein
MTSTLGTLVRQLLGIALCAWGIVVILQIFATAAAALVGYDAPSGGPVLGRLMVGTWAVTSAQLSLALVWHRPQSTQATKD